MPATISKVADRGTHAALDAATTSTLTISNPTSITVGNYLIMRVAGDNSGGGGAARTLTIPNDASGDPRNTWVIHAPANIDPGAASAGCTTWICYAKVDTAYQTGDTIILNWSGNIGANAECLEEWTGIHKTTPVFATPTNQTATGTTLGTAVTGSPNAAGQLFYCAIGWEGIAADTFTQDSDTTNGSWVTPTSVATADATRLNNVRIVGGYKIVTASGAQSWNPTGITSSDMAACAYIFDVDPGDATATAVAQARTTTVGTPTGTGDAVTTAPVTSGTSTVTAVVGDTDNIVPAVARTITSPAASASVTGGADPPNFGVSVVGTDATLTWDDSPTADVTTYDIFHRTPSTTAVFTPGSDTALVEGETSPYVHSGLSSGSHDWQVFGVVSATWTPADLPNLVAWYDASDTGTITESGGLVSQWNDKSGNGFHLTQGTAAQQPTTGSHTLNSLNVLTFTASPTNWLRNSAISITATNTGTWYAVFVPSGTDAYGRVLSLDSGLKDYENTASIAAILRDSTNTNFGSYYNNAMRALHACSNVAHQITTQRNGDTSDCWVDGAAGTQVTGLGTSNFGVTRLWIGNYHDGTAPIAMDLGEMFWSRDADDATTRGNAQTYLKNRWATP